MEVVFTIMLSLHLDEAEHNDIATPWRSFWPGKKGHAKAHTAALL